jgi:Protein of unknown function (DUF3277)
MTTYSFLDVNAALVGPGGAINLGAGAGASEEGITIEATEDIDTMTIGADGTAMHSLHANKSGSVTIRLLKTSPTNQLLANLYAFQTASGSNHGQNTISITNSQTQDVITCRSVAFRKAPSLTYAKEAGFNEWTFNAGAIDRVLGSVT